MDEKNYYENVTSTKRDRSWLNILLAIFIIFLLIPLSIFLLMLFYGGIIAIFDFLETGNFDVAPPGAFVLFGSILLWTPIEIVMIFGVKNLLK